MFNHAILLVTIDEQDYFIDPTLRQDIDSLKYIYLPDFGYGLICDIKTEGLIEINNQTGCQDTIFVSDEYDILSWEMNAIIFKSTIKLTGFPALKLRKACSDDQSRQQTWNFFNNFYQKFMMIHEVINNEIHDNPLKNNQISYTICYRVSLKGFKNQNKQYAFEIIPMDMFEFVFQSLPANLVEDTDFYYGQPVSVDYHIEFIGEKVELVDADKWIVDDDAFHFSKEVFPRLGNYSIKYQFRRLKEVILYKDYLDFFSSHAKMKEFISTIVEKQKRTQPQPFQNIQTKPSRPPIFFIAILIFFIFSFIAKNYHSTTPAQNEYNSIVQTYKKETLISQSIFILKVHRHLRSYHLVSLGGKLTKITITHLVEI